MQNGILIFLNYSYLVIVSKFWVGSGLTWFDVR